MTKLAALLATLLVAPLVVVGACGERAPDASVGRDDPPVSAVAAQLEGGDSGTAPVIATLPAAFVDACVAGDPVTGTPWSLERVGVAVQPIALQPIEALAARDSATLAARIARAVDVLPSDTTVADFHGLPVVVRAAWRFTPMPGDTIVVALVTRRLPMESNPLEELFFLVAAPGSRQGVRDPLVETWFVREVATEETIAVRDLVAAYTVSGKVTLALAHEAESGVRIELLSRRGSAWDIAWNGPLPPCSP